MASNKNTKSWNSIKNAFERRFCKGARINAPSYFLEKVIRIKVKINRR